MVVCFSLACFDPLCASYPLAMERKEKEGEEKKRDPACSVCTDVCPPPAVPLLSQGMVAVDDFRLEKRSEIDASSAVSIVTFMNESRRKGTREGEFRNVYKKATYTKSLGR